MGYAIHVKFVTILRREVRGLAKERTRTFAGGIHPAYHKDRTAGQPIELATVPDLLVFPLSQHIGAPCQPLVGVGDRVLMGQKIGESDQPISAPVHASVSGKVVAVENRPNPCGQPVLSVVVENDRKDERIAPFAKPRPWSELTSDEIIGIVREAGIVGLGGAAFPTHYKLSAARNSTLEAVLLNGAECEPYLTCDHRVMLEQAADVVEGLRIILKAVGVVRGYIGVEENKPDAIAALEQAIADDSNIQVVPLAVKYPQGQEMMLVKAILGREIPPGKLPCNVGAMVSNVGTAAAISAAVRSCRPLTERVVTVTGSLVKQPKNLLTRIGTPFQLLLDQCGLTEQPAKVIQGGPMMGITQSTTDVPVVKGVAGVLVLSEAETTPLLPSPCIRCARCIDVCPLRLQPVFLAQFAERGMMDRAEALNVMDCRECGSCSFICPSRRPLLQNIRLAKNEIAARRKKG